MSCRQNLQDSLSEHPRKFPKNSVSKLVFGPQRGFLGDSLKPKLEAEVKGLSYLSNMEINGISFLFWSNPDLVALETRETENNNFVYAFTRYFCLKSCEHIY